MNSWRNLRGLELVLMGLLLSGVVGCGGRGLYPVSGQVVYKDGSDPSVLARCLVVFDPADAEGPKSSARGEVQPDGSFQMSTFTEGDGVYAGKYRVMVSVPRRSRGLGLLNARYEAFATSGLEITVTGAVSDYKVTVEK